MVDGGDGQLDDWGSLAEALADGRTDRETRDRFWCVLEARVRGLLLQGPANDPDACRLRPRFRGILPDVHAAEDFASEFLCGLLRRFDEGCFHLEDLRGTTAAEGLGRIAAGSLVRMRAITYARHLAGAGVTERPAGSSGVRSLDAGEDGGRAASLSAPPMGRESTAGLLAAAAEDRPVLRLDLEHVSAAAIVATAGLQLHPVLDPEGETFDLVLERLLEALVTERSIDPDLVSAHGTARRALDDQIHTLVEERLAHPGMEPRTVERLERRLVQLKARRVIQPLEGGTVAEFFGLPSRNAGEQRISKYRQAVASLLSEVWNDAMDDEPEA